MPLPELLHARAPHAVRRHLNRTLIRLAVLAVADLLTVEWLRILLTVARDQAWFGDGIAGLVALAMPAGASSLPLQAAMLLGLAICGAYVGGARKRHLRSVAAGAALGVLFVVWGTLFMEPSLALMGGTLLVTGAAIVLFVFMRAWLDQLVERVRPRRALAMRAVLVAPHRDLAAGRRDAAFSDPTEFRFVGELVAPHRDLAAGRRDAAFSDPTEFRFVGDVDVTVATERGGPLGPTAEMMRLIDEQRADTVVLFGHLDAPVAERLARVADAAGCNVVCLPRTFALQGFDTQLVFHHGDPLVRLVRPGERGRQLVVKRVLDVVVALGGLILLAPVFALLALLVRLTSPGPALFGQERVGQGGRTFRMWKFRTMGVGAEEQLQVLRGKNVYGDEPLFKVPNDPRITPLGAFLRVTSLDELPQLWNVLRGEMSLVGPRPPLPGEVRRYDSAHYVR
ncbi:MAG: sugar transferase, partial [Gemmatimonadaceae bacterium]|nr:sugar transferase [Gemmatimonadaceae bacterium]